MCLHEAGSIVSRWWCSCTVAGSCCVGGDTDRGNSWHQGDGQGGKVAGTKETGQREARWLALGAMVPETLRKVGQSLSHLEHLQPVTCFMFMSSYHRLV